MCRVGIPRIPFLSSFEHRKLCHNVGIRPLFFCGCGTVKLPRMHLSVIESTMINFNDVTINVFNVRPLMPYMNFAASADAEVRGKLISNLPSPNFLWKLRHLMKFQTLIFKGSVFALLGGQVVQLAVHRHPSLMTNTTAPPALSFVHRQPPLTITHTTAAPSTCMTR